MITVLGSINMDLIATVFRLPKPGETLAGDNFVTAPGGKGANQALAARRAGADVTMAGACGEDEFAVPALTYLRYDGVGLDRVRNASAATGVALIFVGGDGENVIVIISGANGLVSVQDAEAAVGAMARGDTLMLQLEIPPATIEAALISARAKGIRTILNTAPLTADAPRLAALADIVIANETEFELLVGRAGLDADARELAMLDYGRKAGQTVIVTLGADGVVAARDGKLARAPSLKVDPIDTVGAGDTFCGYFAAGLDAGLKFETALRRAAAAGSLACTKPGAQPSIPFAAEVDASL
ncbi:ribokinase [Rhizobium sp. KVB221]|uniref:Ribokinase n=1 Tax=Rhizobium setariae TaxID=2801340 RepID=A0A937CM12_9HYPH|nr:ribokinase [Rhizobium setariae]MBL0370434.1 ribokinase [Rhizobium setariae]